MSKLPRPYPCPRCKKVGTLKMFVDLFLCIPAHWEHNLTERRRHSKQCEVWGAGWDRAALFCANPKCGWNQSRLGDVVDKMRADIDAKNAEIEALKARVAELEAV